MCVLEHTAAEAGVLEDVSNVYLGGRLCAARQSKIVIEPQDIGSYYFRHCFAGRCKQITSTVHSSVHFLAHVDYFGTDEHLGPMAISMVRETSERKEPNGIVSHVLYRMIVRISDVSLFVGGGISFLLIQFIILKKFSDNFLNSSAIFFTTILHFYLLSGFFES